jgi:translation initiation factor 1 (eIF-1/SUI1)
MSRKKKQKVDINEQEKQAFGQQTNSVFAGLFKSNPSNSKTHNQAKSSLDSEVSTKKTTKKTTKKVLQSTKTLIAHKTNKIYKDNQTSKDPLDLEFIITQIKLVTVSHSRAKRRGKTVSIMTCKGIDLDPKIHKSLTKILSQSLACRVWIESGDVYVQGDQKERICQWLKEHSIKHN